MAVVGAIEIVIVATIILGMIGLIVTIALVIAYSKKENDE
jgi:hypothetical protein